MKARTKTIRDRAEGIPKNLSHGSDRLASVTVPTSIERIKPLPALAAAILWRLPEVDGTSLELLDLLEPESDLFSEIVQVLAGRHAALAELTDVRARIAQANIGEVARIAITALVRGYLRTALIDSEHRRYWRFTLAAAIASSELAEPGNQSRAYAGGLLHDIGRLALIGAFPDKYANLIALTDRMFATGQPFDLLESERNLFGLDRFETAHLLTTTWDLPVWLRPIVGRFRPPAQAAAKDLVSAVRAGARVAHSLGFGYLRNAPRVDHKELVKELPPNARKRWGTLEGLSHLIEGRITSFPP
jgi:hypothetical protein